MALIESSVRKINQKLTIAPPEILSGNNEAITVYDRTVEPAIGNVLIVNVGTAAVKVCYNNTASASTYHTPLAACTAEADGNGGSLQVDDRVQVDKISVFGASAFKVSVIKFLKY